MKIYKNPFVSRESYFVKTGKAFSYKGEAPKTSGFVIEFLDGKWKIRKGQYYDMDLRDEFPIVAENRVSIQKIIDTAVINAVLDLVKGGVKNE